MGFVKSLLKVSSPLEHASIYLIGEQERSIPEQKLEVCNLQEKKLSEGKAVAPEEIVALRNRPRGKPSDFSR